MKALDEVPLPSEDEWDIFSGALLSPTAARYFLDSESCIVPQSHDAEVNFTIPSAQCGVLLGTLTW